MSIVFLFGAGASKGSVDCIPRCPPTGGELFDKLKDAGGVAATIHGELANEFRRDFEKGMGVFFNKRNEDVTALLRDMAKYFAPFNPGPRNLYTRLINLLRGTKEKVVYSTINYDLLIEIAVCQIDLLISYTGLPVKENNLPLLKIHGSCNFLPDVQPGQIQNVTFKFASTSGAILESGIRIAKSSHEVIAFCEEQSSIAPAIVMYHESKWPPYCPKFIKQQQKWWQYEVQRAKRIFIIGAGVHLRDTHIWETLAKSAAWLGYVGGKRDAEEFIRWASTNNKEYDVVANSFNDAIPLIEQYIN